ncbi:MAG TPA: hypothetical protein VIV12_29295 [Streptosporangiaceae bacterium]
MARIRSIKPEFWDDRKLAKACSRDARLFYVALWNLADEHGRINGDTQYLKGRCFPYDDDLNDDALVTLLDELSHIRRVQRYETDGDPYLFLPQLAKHQRLEPDKVPSRLPPPPAQTSRSASASRARSSGRRADKSAPDPDESALKHVAGSREHVAGSRGSRSAALVPSDGGAAQPLTVTQRSKRLTDAYAEAEPMCKWPAVNGIVIKAIKSGRYSDDEIHDGLLRLANEGRGVTVETLRTEMNGQPPLRASPHSTTDQRVAQALALKSKFAAQPKELEQ